MRDRGPLVSGLVLLMLVCACGKQGEAPAVGVIVDLVRSGTAIPSETIADQGGNYVAGRRQPTFNSLLNEVQDKWNGCTALGSSV